jgi:hypothetical protein
MVPSGGDNDDLEEYKRALEILVRQAETGEAVKDDTYAEKFVTETARAITADSKFAMEHGLHETATMERMKNGNDFLVNLVLHCAQVDDQMLGQAEQLCREAVEGNGRDLLESMPMLQLMTFLVAKRPELEDQGGNSPNSSKVLSNVSRCVSKSCV